MSRRRRGPLRAVALALTAAASLSACGGEEQGDATTARSPDDDALTVAAAASLRTAFTAYAGATTPAPRFSFAASDTLAAQLRQGFAPDVFAAASAELPAQLHREGLVDAPRVFARNELVLAVPAAASGQPIDSVDDLTRAGVTIAAGRPGVPVGDYTEAMLQRLPAATAAAIRAGIRSRENDVAGIVGKLSQGAVDAGFVYASDVRASDGRLRAIRLPQHVRPLVEYAAAAVTAGKRRVAAQAFVDGLVSPAGTRALRRAGLQPVAAP